MKPLKNPLPFLILGSLLGPWLFLVLWGYPFEPLVKGFGECLPIHTLIVIGIVGIVAGGYWAKGKIGKIHAFRDLKEKLKSDWVYLLEPKFNTSDNLKVALAIITGIGGLWGLYIQIEKALSGTTYLQSEYSRAVDIQMASMYIVLLIFASVEIYARVQKVYRWIVLTNNELYDWEKGGESMLLEEIEHIEAKGDILFGRCTLISRDGGKILIEFQPYEKEEISQFLVLLAERVPIECTHMNPQDIPGFNLKEEARKRA